MSTIKAGLIAGRHPMPVDLYVFKQVDDPTDIESIDQEARTFVMLALQPSVEYGSGLNQWDYTDVECLRCKHSLELYVTGLSAALAAVIKWCALEGAHLTLMHWDSEAEEYIPQRMF